MSPILLLPVALWATSASPASPIAVETLVDGTTLVHARVAGALAGEVPVSVRYVVRAGSADDPAHLAGLAHLLSRAVLHGTYEEPERVMWERVAAAGGSMRARALPELTAYSLDVPVHELASTMPSFLSMVTSPALPLADLEREKAVVAAELAVPPPASGQGASVGDHETGACPLGCSPRMAWGLDQLAFPAPRQDLTGMGTTETRAAITLDDLQSFYAEHYTTRNSAIIVVGDVGLAEAKKLAEEGLRSAPGIPGPALDQPASANAPSESRSQSRITVTIQGRVVDGFPAGACLAAAELLELRLRKKVFADERMPAWVDGFCHHQRGHDFLVLSVVTSSPESSLLVDWMKELVRAASTARPSSRERALVESRRKALLRSTNANPSALGWAIALAISRDDLSIGDAVNTVVKPPRLDWGRVPALLSAASSDKALVELHFSRFEE